MMTYYLQPNAGHRKRGAIFHAKKCFLQSKILQSTRPVIRLSTSLATDADRRVVVDGVEGNPGSISPAGIAPGKKHPPVSLGVLSSLKAYLK
jgi:hypothetical protein